jgi:proteasome lid subunit RPN8/RPN11
MTIRIKSGAVDGITEHSLRDVPNECCGLLGGRGSLISTVYPVRNVAASPETRYEAAPEDLFHATRKMREKGEELLGIYHSHPRSPAYPSPTDVQLAFYPDAVYFIVSLADERTIMNAFRIYEGEISGVEYDVIPEQTALSA